MARDLSRQVADALRASADLDRGDEDDPTVKGIALLGAWVYEFEDWLAR
jgi:hypothetical protein